MSKIHATIPDCQACSRIYHTNWGVSKWCLFLWRRPIQYFGSEAFGTRTNVLKCIDSSNYKQVLEGYQRKLDSNEKINYMLDHLYRQFWLSSRTPLKFQTDIRSYFTLSSSRAIRIELKERHCRTTEYSPQNHRKLELFSTTVIQDSFTTSQNKIKIAKMLSYH